MIAVEGSRGKEQAAVIIGCSTLVGQVATARIEGCRDFCISFPFGHGLGKITGSLGGGAPCRTLEPLTSRQFLTTPWQISCQPQEFDYSFLASTV